MMQDTLAPPPITHPRFTRDAAKPEMAAGVVLAIASGKGGVGKTWFAITLAHALARTGERVLLFDADLGLANVDIQLGVTPTHDLASIVMGRVALADAIQTVPDAGFDVLAGASGSGALASIDPGALERMLASLGAVSSKYDRVVLDLGAGVDRAVRRLAAWANTLLVVATEEPTSLTDAYATLKLYAADRAHSSQRGGDARLVVNQIATPAGGARTFATLARASQAFLGRTPTLAGTIRRDPHVPESIRRQSLLLTRHPNTAAALDVQAIAQSLGRARPLS